MKAFEILLIIAILEFSFPLCGAVPTIQKGGGGGGRPPSRRLAPLARRQLPRPDEYNILANCIDKKGVKTSEIAYFRVRSDTPDETARVDSPTGRHRTWQGVKTTARFPDGVAFSVVLGPVVPQGEFSGTASNGYEEFTCWRVVTQPAYTVDGRTCDGMYECNHDAKPETTQKSTAEPTKSSVPEPTKSSAPEPSPSPVLPVTVSPAPAPSTESSAGIITTDKPDSEDPSPSPMETTGKALETSPAVEKEDEASAGRAQDPDEKTKEDDEKKKEEEKKKAEEKKKEEEEKREKQNDRKLAIILGVTVPVGVAILVPLGALLYKKWKKRKAGSQPDAAAASGNNNIGNGNSVHGNGNMVGNVFRRSIHNYFFHRRSVDSLARLA